MTRNTWAGPDGNEKLDRCSCTPLADDPACVLHGKEGYVPPGEEPLKVRDLFTDPGKPAMAIRDSVIILGCACIITSGLILLFLLIGAAIRAYFWMIGA